MKYLAIETSSALCGVCITEETNLIDKLEIENGLTHSQNLMPLIQELLDKNNLKIADINGFICDIGPGSFTGIRIGVATAKAFVDSFDNISYTGVSSLEALAYNVNINGFVASIIDCKNDNCYFALYNLNNNSLNEIISPIAVSITEMYSLLDKYKNNEITFVGDGALIYKQEITDNTKNSKFLNENENKISTYNLALAGLKKINNNTTLDLLPLYLKKPQAERLLEEKDLKNGK
ncbi:MAG: tRNA (adenosine(37)-N6)-threonylcarbamoyltransferase complex dimerization subunit type 1 TsaB [Clostridia bacterium]|nr:tRNA (adenosine(37)-N6)-threonylcarbamoyltransferase complex dimerization subunit type 1 TsaB [Clostridia bacterium]